MENVNKYISFTSNSQEDHNTIISLLESLAEGVVVIDDNGKIVFINTRMTNLTGYRKEEVSGKTLNLFIPEKHHFAHSEHIKKFLSKPQIRPMGSGMSFNAKRKDGTQFPVEISLSSFKTNEGTFAIGFITDISKRKEIENELMERNLELDAYAHTVAHDLNNSISGMIGFAQFLRDNDDLVSSSERKKYLDSISKRGIKLSNVLREMLIFASMRKKDIKPEPIETEEFVNGAIDRLEFQIKEYNAVITKSENWINCIAYGPWVEEIWYNFISNAVKYGGEPPEVFIGCNEAKNGFVEYYVEDKGNGIEPLKVKELLSEENFVSDSQKGFGLGISIVKRIIKKLDGKFILTSRVGNGTRFSFLMKKA